MLRKTLAALAASLVFLSALGAQALSAITDGTSNTILLTEIPPAPALPAITDGTSNTILLPEIPPAPEPPVAEPPVAEPPAPSFSHSFAGSAKLVGDAFKASQPYTLQMSFDTAALTFLAMDADGTLYSGHLVPKGSKFRLFLDGPSADALAADVAARGAAAAGRSAGRVLGESSKLTLKLNQDGSASLKIKGDVLVNGLGEVSFKANLSSASN